MITLLAGLALACLLMILTWIFARRVDNYGIVDGVWALSFTIMALLFAVAEGGWLPRRYLMLGMVALWSLRLGFHLSKRIASHHPEEDTRYAALRAEYGANLVFRFFLFFQMQGVSVLVLSVPFWLMARNPAPQFSPLEFIGAFVFVIGVLGEATADRQLAKFKSKPANRGEVCDIGLWQYSRHPNYFFESVIWFGFFFCALGSPTGWAAIYAPLTMLLLLLKVTGVPPAEAQSLKSRGDKYRAYQKRTSIFLPWFPKEQ